MYFRFPRSLPALSPHTMMIYFIITTVNAATQRVGIDDHQPVTGLRSELYFLTSTLSVPHFCQVSFADNVGVQMRHDIFQQCLWCVHLFAGMADVANVVDAGSRSTYLSRQFVQSIFVHNVSLSGELPSASNLVLPVDLILSLMTEGNKQKWPRSARSLRSVLLGIMPP